MHLSSCGASLHRPVPVDISACAVPGPSSLHLRFACLAYLICNGLSFTFKRPSHSWKRMLVFCPQNYLEFWSSPTSFPVFPYLLEHRADDCLPALHMPCRGSGPLTHCTRNPTEPTLSHSEPPLLLILQGQVETTCEHKRNFWIESEGSSSSTVQTHVSHASLCQLCALSWRCWGLKSCGLFMFLRAYVFSRSVLSSSLGPRGL